LHQTDDDYLLIRNCYQSLGVQFYLRGEPDKAVTLYTLAFSYYNPDTDDFKAVLHCTLYERARAYLYQNKLAQAREDVEYLLSHYPQAHYFLELLGEVEEEEKLLSDSA
jgi:tetratricopeptide (TPR) repeat protein